MAPRRHLDRLPNGDITSWQVPGPGPPVVCVHGAGVSSRLFAPLLSRLEGVREAWALDLPGYGRSSARDAVATLPSLADSLLDWLDARGLGGACLLGMSFGCQIAVEAALLRRENAGTAAAGAGGPLVLVGPTLDPRGRSPLGVLTRWLRNSRGERPSLLGPTLADYRDAGTRRMFAAFALSVRDRIEDKLPLIEAPTLVVRGGRDRLVPQEWAEEATRLLPRGRLRVIPGSSHTLSHNAPAALAGLVVDFTKGAP